MHLGTTATAWPQTSARQTDRDRLAVLPAERLHLCFGMIRPEKVFDLATKALSLPSRGYRLAIVGE